MKIKNQSQATRFYQSLKRIRKIEESIAAEYSKQEMRCPVHLSIGQEAVAVGVSEALTKKDLVFSTHRAHAHYLAKGGSFPRMLAEIYGKKTGCSKGIGGSMHLFDKSCGFLGCTPIVGSTIPIAVGSAFTSSYNKDGLVTVVYFGEGATEEGVFYESANFAVLKKLPIVFVCENNLYSVYSPLEVRQPGKRDLLTIARGLGLPAEKEDGNHTYKVYSQTKKAVERARKNMGPTLLQFDTFRWREHCGPNYDNHIGYRTEKEFQQWKNKCPVERQKNFLKKRGVLPPKLEGQIDKKIKEEIKKGFKFARQSPFPSPSQLSKNVYSGA